MSIMLTQQSPPRIEYNGRRVNYRVLKEEINDSIKNKEVAFWFFHTYRYAFTRLFSGAGQDVRGHDRRMFIEGTHPPAIRGETIELLAEKLPLDIRLWTSEEGLGKKFRKTKSRKGYSVDYPHMNRYDWLEGTWTFALTKALESRVGKRLLETLWLYKVASEDWDEYKWNVGIGRAMREGRIVDFKTGRPDKPIKGKLLRMKR